MRKTEATIQVALALMAAPNARHWGYDVGKTTGLRSGVLYPIIHRMFDQGWLEDGWEDQAHGQLTKRPPRRYYTLTNKGIAELGGLLVEARTESRFNRLVPGWST